MATAPTRFEAQGTIPDAPSLNKHKRQRATAMTPEHPANADKPVEPRRPDTLPSDIRIVRAAFSILKNGVLTLPGVLGTLMTASLAIGPPTPSDACGTPLFAAILATLLCALPLFIIVANDQHQPRTRWTTLRLTLLIMMAGFTIVAGVRGSW